MCQLRPLSWGVSLSYKFILDTICPQMGSIRVQQKLLMSPAEVVLGMLPQNLLGAPSHTCAQCPPPTIAIKTPALGRSVGYTCTVRLKFQVQGYWLSLLMGRALSRIACTLYVYYTVYMYRGPIYLLLCHLGCTVFYTLCSIFHVPVGEGCSISIIRHHSCGNKQIVWNSVDTLYTQKCSTGLILVWPRYLLHFSFVQVTFNMGSFELNILILVVTMH